MTQHLTAVRPRSMGTAPDSGAVSHTRRYIVSALIGSTALVTAPSIAGTAADLLPATTFHEIMIVELLPPAGSHSDTWSGLAMDGSGQRWAFSADRAGSIYHCFEEVRHPDIRPGDTQWASANSKTPDALRVSVRRAIGAASDVMELSRHDPIFAAIERHRQLWAEYVAICDRTDIADGDAHDAMCDEAGKAQGAALTELMSVTPTSLAGCALLLQYVDHTVAEAEQGQLFEGFDGAEEPARDLLTRVANVINAMVVRL